MDIHFVVMQGNQKSKGKKKSKTKHGVKSGHEKTSANK
jgi:hypothetical protein